MTVALIAAVCFVLIFYIQFVQKNSIIQCYAVLDDAHEQISQMIVNEMKSEQDHLDSASSLIGELSIDFENNRDFILKIMNALNAGSLYSHWEFCFPDGHVIKNDGSEFELSPMYSFEDRISKDFVVSERRTAIKDGKTQIIMLSRSVFQDDVCIGILSSVVDLYQFSEYALKNIHSSNRYGILVFQGNTGDVLIDTHNNFLGNVKGIEQYKDEYKWKEIKSIDVTDGKSHASYNSKKYDETVYLSYYPIEFSDWKLFVSCPDSVCMKAANGNRKYTYNLLGILLIFFGIYAHFILVEERRRQKLNAEREVQLKDALKKAEVASEAKSSFLFNMSHDLRTPLNAIIGFTGLLEKNLDNKEKSVGYLDKIKTSNEFLLSLVNNVLEMARIESGKAVLDEVSVDAKNLFDYFISTFEPQFADKNIDSQFIFNVNNSHILCDPTKIREIFINLLSNALKFTPAGGKVCFEVRETPSEMNGYVVYKTTVTDTGIGMSKEYLPQLFDKFEREYSTTVSKISGTGLGMPIVKNLVDLMDGTIDVESEIGKGTKFTLYIPHKIAEVEGVEKLVTSVKEFSLVKFKGKRILLAEDNDLNAEIAEAILVEAGFIVDRVIDGVECISKLEKSEDNYYCLILMDIQMPVMDGYKATGEIRRMSNTAKNKISIVAMTANAFDEDIRNCLDSGMDGHVAKPINVEVLLQTLNSILE